MKATGKKLTVLLLLAGITVGAFATLGEGNLRKDKSRKSLLTNKRQAIPGMFSLQSGYSFRGNQVINPDQSKYINLNNTVVTYQQGNVTYTLPSQKKVILNNKITFNPNAATR